MVAQAAGLYYAMLEPWAWILVQPEYVGEHMYACDPSWLRGWRKD